MSQPQFTAAECCQAPEQAKIQVIEFVAMCAAVANNLVPNLLSASKALLHSKKNNMYIYILIYIYIYINITHQSVTLPNRKHNWFQVDCTCGPKGWTVRDLDLSWQPEKGTGKNDTNDHSILKETKNVRIS